MIAILLSFIINTFYKRRFEKEEREKSEQGKYLKDELMKRPSEIEEKHEKCIDTINDLK